MTIIVIGPDDKISGTVVVTPPPSEPPVAADEAVADADDPTEQEIS